MRRSREGALLLLSTLRDLCLGEDECKSGNGNSCLQGRNRGSRPTPPQGSKPRNGRNVRRGNQHRSKSAHLHRSPSCPRHRAHAVGHSWLTFYTAQLCHWFLTYSHKPELANSLMAHETSFFAFLGVSHREGG